MVGLATNCVAPVSALRALGLLYVGLVVLVVHHGMSFSHAFQQRPGRVPLYPTARTGRSATTTRLSRHRKYQHRPERQKQDAAVGSGRRVQLNGLQGWVNGGLILSASADADDEAEPDNDDANVSETDDATSNSEENEEQQHDNDASAPSKIDNLIRDLHSTPYAFRIVVIGNGAILETTSRLGPYMAESTSPKSGERLVTLASEDRKFEFHLKVDSIDKVTLTESKKGEGKTLRIVRMMREEDPENIGSSGKMAPVCSLILAEGSEESAQWFRDMTIRYGYEVCAGD